MSCDFSKYNGLRDATRNASVDAQAACAAEDTARAALSDAQQALQNATVSKQQAYATWESAERAENAEAKKLGIDPTPVQV